MTRADETGRVYPYSNQAADLVNLLERQLERWQVQLLTGCTGSTLPPTRLPTWYTGWSGSWSAGRCSCLPAARCAPWPKAGAAMLCRWTPSKAPAPSTQMQ